MSLNVVLAVGLDSWLLSLQASVLRSAGYIVVSAVSIKDAIDYFKAGDFDLVLLGRSISSEHKKNLTFQIRQAGSRTPVVCLAGHPGERAPFADAMLDDEPNALLTGMRGLLEKESKMWAAQPFMGACPSHAAR
jgi:DNA-binding NtrC family response regulator